ncbi:MAG: hypothetical protein DSM106950_04980 [Stigonema ocellatum SAG 48.90 = DSM 106950]|nr:hypothetical protein [Stigonema ocellatum SAG 48.90 = DSM 106950]
MLNLAFARYRHHDEALSRLEANSVRHDEALSRLEANLTRLEANSVRHDEAINRMESAIENMTYRLDRVVEQSASERETFIAEIPEIWRYLRY